MSNPYLHLVTACWRYATNRHAQLLACYAMFIVSNTISMMQPLVVANIINTLQKGGPELFARVLPWLLLLPGIDLLVWIFHGPARIIERKTAFFIAKNYAESHFKMITELPLTWHRDHHTGESYDKVDKARKALFEFADGNFWNITTIIQIIVAFIAIQLFLPLYGTLALLVGIVLILVIRKFNASLIKNENWLNIQENKVSAGLFDYISNITTVITLRLERLAQREISKRITAIFKTFHGNSKINEWKWFSTNMIVAIGSICLLSLYILNQISATGTILAGSVIALYQYLEKLNGAFDSFSWQWEQLIYKTAKLKNAQTIEHAHESYIKKHRKQPLPENWKTITITNLSFTHGDSRKHAQQVNNISLTLERGKKIALVGESGSGKSTIMRLLRGLDTPDSGTLFLDGKIYETIEPLSSATTLFPQDPEIFENTIEYNITAGLRHQKREVTKAIKLAAFEKIAMRLPKKLDSNIKEKGVNLSGGEKQRLALARGIFAAKESTILLFDEPTSSVDTKNELLIYKNLFQHFRKQCIVSSIHRLHLLRLFDVVMVLENGKIIEQGSPQELLQNPNGILKKSWDEYLQHQKHGNIVIARSPVLGTTKQSQSPYP